ncbi:MAG: tetratricopeptide repeat protein [Candidatus Binatia bacterium]
MLAQLLTEALAGDRAPADGDGARAAAGAPRPPAVRPPRRCRRGGDARSPSRAGAGVGAAAAAGGARLPPARRCCPCPRRRRRGAARAAARRGRSSRRATTLLEIGELERAADLYRAMLDDPATEPEAREALARLCLWRGDLEGALAEADALPRDGTVARRVRAAVSVLRGDPVAARALLDAVIGDDPRDGEAYLWRAEAHLRLRQRDAAHRDVDRGLQHGYAFAAFAVRLLAELPPPTRINRLGEAMSRAYLRLRPTARTWAKGVLRQVREELHAEITATCADGAAMLADTSARRLAAALECSLRAMRGNRTPRGTWVRADGTLAPLPPTTSPRILARAALELVRVAPVAEVRRALDALAARFPDSSMPIVHRGELHLWLGDYAAARADLEAAIALHRETRWAWYGLAWLDVLAGDPRRALQTCAEGIAVMHHSEGAVALIVRGEAYRLLGRLDEARRELQRSNEVFPSRLSAWINLALVHGAAGDGDAQRATMRRIAAMAPTLVSQAAAELGEATFEHVVLERPWRRDGAPVAALDALLRHLLTMMRGNRASGLITYFTRAGELRHVPRGGRDDRLLAPPSADRLARLRGALDQLGARR